MMTIMVRLQTAVIVVLSVAVLALLAILFVVYERPATLTASSPAKTAASPQQTLMATQPVSSPEVERFLHAPKDPAAMQAEQRMQKEKMERLKNLQVRFKELSANGKTPDIDELDKLLGELIEIQGTSVIAGVDLNVLRQNLRAAQEVQALAKELELESKKPKPDQNRILKITEEIQAMQGKMKADIMAGGNAAAPVSSPPAADAQKGRKGP